MKFKPPKRIGGIRVQFDPSMLHIRTLFEQVGTRGIPFNQRL